MAKLENPLGFERFGLLKGVVDFAYYKGTLYARMYPVKIRQPGTPAQTNCWIAMREAHYYKRLMTLHDQEGYRTLTGGSHLTWWDMFKKVFIRGWHVLQSVPPVLYDTQVSITHGGKINMCFRCDQRVEVQIWSKYSRTKEIRPWSWSWQDPKTVPPNCSQRVELVEYWDKVQEEEYDQGGAQVCFDIGQTKTKGGLWITTVVRRQHGQETLWRTGSWWLAF